MLKRYPLTTRPVPPFERYVPAPAVGYCLHLWQQHDFTFAISRPRRSRLGTHQFDPAEGHHITVNADLNPAAFLITYLHEVAHVRTVRQARRRVLPHGTAWKTHFRDLLQPVLTETVFPLSVLDPLRSYARNPTASTASYAPLLRALQGLDTRSTEVLTVDQIPQGESFTLGKRVFLRGPLRRTRVLCTEQTTGRRYTVPAHAQVERA